MAAGIEIYNYVTNQKGSPAIYSDTLANRPAAGFIGRLFVSTDTLEIYRDNGTTWDLISGGGGPAVNIYNSNGTLTGARTMTMANNNLTFEGGANPARLIISANNNVARIFSFRTAGSQRWAFRVDDNETGSNAGGNWYLRAYDDAGTFTISPFSVERASGEKSMLAVETLSVGSANLTGLFNVAGATYQAGLTMTGGNPHGASHNNFTLANVGNITFANSIYLGAQSNVLRLQANNSGTITLNAASPGIRTAAATLNQVQYNTSTGAAITYTHASVMQTLGFYRLVAAGSLTVTNAYGLIVNDLNEYGYAATGAGALALTNRWGIYQDSTTDVNYLGGTTLIGTTTNAGYKLDVSGTLRNTLNANFATTSGSVGIGTTTPNAKLEVFDGSIFVNQDRSIAWNVSGGSTLRAYIIGTSGNELQFWNRQGGINTQAVTINALGNIGINTITPAFLLDIQKNQNTETIARVYNTSTGASGNSQVRLENSASRLDVAIRSTGASPFGALDAGSSYVWYNGTTSLVIGATDAAGIIKFNTGGTTERVRITSGGNVLIGSTTDPGVKLYVNGETRISTTSSAGDYSLQNGNAIYTANNSVGIAIATQNARFQAGEYGIGVGSGSFDSNQRNCVNVALGVAPSTTITDVFNMYAADITAGNAAPHFRTENGNVIKIYQETTGVAASAFTANTGTAVNDASTFDGYTLKQVVKALRNLGILA